MAKSSARTKQTIDTYRSTFAKKYNLHDLSDAELMAVRAKYLKYVQYPGIPIAVAIVLSFVLFLAGNEVGPEVNLPYIIPLLVVGFGVGIPLLAVGNSKLKKYLAEFRPQHEASQQAASAQQAQAESMRRQQAETAQRQAAMETQAQREAKDKQRVETLKSLVEMSEEIMLDDLAGVLDLSRVDLLRKITEWGKMFAIKLKGDRVVIGREDVAGFVARLDQEMKEWGHTEAAGAGKKG